MRNFPTAGKQGPFRFLQNTFLGLFFGILALRLGAADVTGTAGTAGTVGAAGTIGANGTNGLPGSVGAAATPGSTGGAATNGANGGIGGIGTIGGDGALGNAISSTQAIAGTTKGGAGGIGGLGGRGGNGGGGGTGGTGGPGGPSSSFGVNGGAGGVGGIGGKGGTGGKGGPGNMGGNGATGVIISTGSVVLTVNGVVAGGAGGTGGTGGTGGSTQGGQGGPGGVGGAGPINAKGGKGGNGGAGGLALGGAGGDGGHGGNGGMGISSAQSSVTVINNGTISGGSLGAGGQATEGTNGPGGEGGGGGSGGSGGAGAGSQGTSGSSAGNEFSSDGSFGNLGTGGVAISFTGGSSAVITSGTITGGTQNGGNADAVDLTGSNNTLELLSGSAITGKVVASGGSNNTLALGGTTNSSFAISQLGVQYLGFNTFEKVDPATWSLTGTSSFAGGITINGGILSIASSVSLGISAVSIGNGAFLQYVGSTGGITQNITIPTANTGVIASSGGGVTNLSGTLTNSGGILALCSGTFVVSGTITGSSAPSELMVGGNYTGATVGLTTANSYNGPTMISMESTVLTGVSGALPASTPSDIMIGDSSIATVLVNTLDLLGTSQTINSLTSVGTSVNQVISSNGTASSPPTIGAGPSTASVGSLNINYSGVTTDTYLGLLGDSNGTRAANNFSVTKTGTGTFVLSGSNTYTKGTTISGGTLLAANTTGSATGPGNVAVANGGTLGGTGTVGQIILDAGGTVQPGTPGSIGTLNATVFRWYPSSLIKIQLSNSNNTSSLLNMGSNSAFVKGSGIGAFTFDFLGTGEVGQVYTLINFGGTSLTSGLNGNTNFNVDDFSIVNLPTGLTGVFSFYFNGTTESLLFTVVQSEQPVFINTPLSTTIPAGTAYNFAYSANGSPSPTFFVGEGSLPPGLTLYSNGYLSGTPSTSGTYTGTVTATNPTGPDVSQYFSIAVTSGYTAWVAQEGLSGPSAAETAVLQLDGYNNLFKYALGLHASISYNPGDPRLPIVQKQYIAGVEYLTLTFTGVAIDVTYTVQSADDTSEFSAPPDNTVYSDPPNALGTITVRDSQPMSSSLTRYMRLKVTTP